MSSVSSRVAGVRMAGSLVTLVLLAAVAHAAERGPSPAASASASAGTLRVCADPNNLPFSNDRGQGFENAIARMAAADLHRTVAYTWFPQRRGFVRNTLKAKLCDVVIGVPTRLEMVQATAPYYRSSYVFVTRRDRHLDIRSFDDPRLRTLRIGVHAVGDDYANVPPALALARRGIVDNLHGYSIYGDYSQPNPPRALIDAVADGSIDVAVAWGPFAGYFAREEKQPLAIHPVEGVTDPALAMRYDISMGVRKDDAALRRALDGFIARRREAIHDVLVRYGIPVVPDDATDEGRH
jgi:mxaJ protein